MDNARLTSNIFDELRPKPIRRRYMLPGWIQFFCWLFLTVGTLIALWMVYYIIFEDDHGPGKDNFMLIAGSWTAGILLFKSFIAYSLLTERDWAVIVGLIEGYMYLAILLLVLFLMYYTERNFNYATAMQVIAIIPYIIKLHQVRAGWQRNAYRKQHISDGEQWNSSQ